MAVLNACVPKRSRRNVFIFLCLCLFLIFFISEDDAVMYLKYTARIFIPEKQSLSSHQRNIRHHINIETDLPTTSPIPLPKTEGFTRAQETYQICWGNNTEVPKNNVKLILTLENKNKTLVYCPIYKVGTTFFKRLFLLDTAKTQQGNNNPYTIPYNARLEMTGGIVSARKYEHRVMFVRDPYRRLVSAFVDKLLAPNPVYWKIISINAIRLVRADPSVKSLQCGHDLTFSEYVNYVIRVLTPGSLKRYRRDEHFMPMVELCKPCAVQYDFIGKMEYFATDALAVVDLLGRQETKRILQINGSALSADDALMDTCHQPFYFYQEYKHCISKFEALQRAWKKLQIRGIIGNQTLPVSEKEADQLTQDEFFDLAREARRMSSKKDRQLMQDSAFKHFFDTVSLGELKKIQVIYKDDFRIFNYNDAPAELYDRFWIP